ncbi:MAG: hypothetical protein BWY28_03090 [bacterium ADurb.Bin236]|nr:MAG: hypothetical protein BWY28_03090 [bacterium ADurb.Bin236]HOY64227.1 hypothetical protein [bacterium]HPN95704.1 hypothetical protein [bacterium]
MDKLIKFLLKLYANKFYGCVIIKFENGKATHVEMNSTRKWEYKELPDA